MKNLFQTRLIFSLIFSVFFLNSFAQNQQDTLKTLITDWQPVSITDSDGNPVKSIGDEDYLVFQDENTFEYELKKEQLKAKGSWKLLNGQLVFHYDAKNDSTTHELTRV